jgi:hypothetical protein
MTLLSRLAAAVLIFTSLGSLSPAQTLGEIVTKTGTEWIIGKWGDPETKGQVLALTLEWRLERHAIATTAKLADRTSEGMIGVKPGTSEVFQVSLDNHGVAAKGKWGAFDGQPMMRVEYSTPEGDEGKLAVVYRKKDANGLVITIHKLDESGAPKAEIERSITLVRLE